MSFQRPHWLAGLLFALVCTTHVSGCSHFVPNYTQSLLLTHSARTMDLGSSLDWMVHSFPRGATSRVFGMSWTSKYGYVGFTPRSFGAFKRRWPLDGLNLGLLTARDVVSDGLNEAGLSCGFLTLVDAKFQRPRPLEPHRNLFSFSLCKWALENFETAAAVEEAVKELSVWFDSQLHFVVTDSAGTILVLEFLQGEQRLMSDPNDGLNGFGIMTNEPDFLWQTRNVQQLEWKQSLARSAVSLPGNFYPDERFLRVHLIKSAMERSAPPATYRDAIAKAVAIMNSVTVPMGDIPGTDSGKGSGEGAGDHTQWGVIRDHTPGNSTYFLRSQTNPSWRRLQLAKLNLKEGSPVESMIIEDDAPWFVDVERRFTSNDL